MCRGRGGNQPAARSSEAAFDICGCRASVVGAARRGTRFGRPSGAAPARRSGRRAYWRRARDSRPGHSNARAIGWRFFLRLRRKHEITAFDDPRLHRRCRSGRRLSNRLLIGAACFLFDFARRVARVRRRRVDGSRISHLARRSILGGLSSSAGRRRRCACVRCFCRRWCRRRRFSRTRGGAAQLISQARSDAPWRFAFGGGPGKLGALGCLSGCCRFACRNPRREVLPPVPVVRRDEGEDRSSRESQGQQGRPRKGTEERKPCAPPVRPCHGTRAACRGVFRPPGDQPTSGRF